MKTFVIIFSRGVFMKRNFDPQPMLVDGGYTNSGWRPLLWTRKLIDAEKFSSREHAISFGQACIPHDLWDVEEITATTETGTLVA